MIDYSLAYCYGIIVSRDVIDEITEVLSDDEFDEFIDNYSRCVNSWTNEDYFIGIADELSESITDFVYDNISDLTPPAEDDEDLIDLKRFFDEHNLWDLISWEPKMYLINFCF